MSNALALREDETSLGPAEKAEVLDRLYELFTMKKVVEKTGYSLRRIMNALDSDVEFANAIQAAERHLSVIGEDELKRRAIFGVDNVVVANGRVVYVTDADGKRKPLVETKYSDALLKTYLEANRRDKFGAKLEMTTTHKGVIALPQIPIELMHIMLAQARGESVELIIDENMDPSSMPEVIDADYEDVTVASAASGDDQDSSSGSDPLAEDGGSERSERNLEEPNKWDF